MANEDRRIEYLEICHKKAEAVNQILEGINKIHHGGVVGLRLAVNADPEMVIEAFNSLGYVIESYQKEVLDLTEKWLSMLDMAEEHRVVIDKLTKELYGL